MVVLGVAAIVELGSIDNRADYLGTNSVPTAQTIGTIETAAANFRRVQADLIVARAARRPKLMSQLGPYATEATKTLAGYADSVTDPTNRKLWSTTKAEWASYLKSTSKVDDDMRAGDKAAASARSTLPGRHSISSPRTATPGTALAPTDGGAASPLPPSRPRNVVCRKRPVLGRQITRIRAWPGRPPSSTIRACTYDCRS